MARADLNGKAGHIASWDFALQRYTVEIEKEEKKKESEAPANPDMFGLDAGGLRSSMIGLGRA